MPRAALVWAALAASIAVPFAIAAASPLQAWRSAPYIAGSLAGVLALAALLVQPLLAAGYLPGLRGPRALRWHLRLGTALVVLVAVHIGGLYLASPADATDALLLVSPTPFSVYGVTAMWAVVLTALLVALRRRLPVRMTTWRIVHYALALVVVGATIVHALMIEGAMGSLSKVFLCALAGAATLVAVMDLRLLRRRRRAN